MQKITYKNKDYEPSKVICVGRNYVEHIRELENEMPDELVLFIKPNSSICDQIYLPDQKCRYEGEISFLMKDGQVEGVGFGLDMTLVDVQKRLKKKGLPWEKSKAFNKSAVLSQFVTYDGDLGNLRIELWINGEMRQTGGVELMIHKPQDILVEIDRHFTVENYDVIMTGTPQGVGYFDKGDQVVGKLFENDKLLVEQNWIVK